MIRKDRVTKYITLLPQVCLCACWKERFGQNPDTSKAQTCENWSSNPLKTKSLTRNRSVDTVPKCSHNQSFIKLSEESMI